ncbi:MAG: zf-HC2 domain-containing protein [Pseudomonadota bacterium]
MLNCRDATRLMSEAQERGLPLKERVALGLHVAMCKGCHNFRVQMDALRKTARAYAKGEDKQAG